APSLRPMYDSADLLSLPLEVAEPLAALHALASLPHAFLLHSALSGPRARWSFFGADPFAWHQGPGYDEGVRRWRQWRRGQGRREAETPPFTGGVVGAWSYDFGRRFERLPARAADDLGFADVHLGFYDVVGAFDHETGQARLYSSGLPLEGA